MFYTFFKRKSPIVGVKILTNLKDAKYNRLQQHWCRNDMRTQDCLVETREHLSSFSCTQWSLQAMRLNVPQTVNPMPHGWSLRKKGAHENIFLGYLLSSSCACTHMHTDTDTKSSWIRQHLFLPWQHCHLKCTLPICNLQERKMKNQTLSPLKLLITPQSVASCMIQYLEMEFILGMNPLTGYQ